MTKTSAKLALVTAITAFAVTGCFKDKKAPEEPVPTGSATFSITDAPVDNVATLKLTIDGLALKRVDQPVQIMNLDTPLVIPNLLDLTGGVDVDILSAVQIPVGEYESIGFYVVGGGSDSTVTEDDTTPYPLYIPGQEPADVVTQRDMLEVPLSFTVAKDGSVDVTFDFDLRKALTFDPAGAGHYMLKPVIRVVDTATAGSITGTVAAAHTTDISCTNDNAANSGEGEGNAVYIFAGVGVTAGDVNLDAAGADDHATDDLDADTAEVSPVTVANVLFDGIDYTYTAGFLPAGDYTVAFTCQSLDDEIETDEATAFVGSTTVTVTAGAATTNNIL